MQSGQRLAGRIALVTGGGGGIGAALASLFCREGARVVIVDANAEALARTVSTVRAEQTGASLISYQADVADEAQAIEAVALAQREFGGLDVLVNNAAMRNYSALAEATRDEWQSIVGVNMVGTATYCKAALPLLRRHGRASIVNVSSCYAVTGRKGMGLYDATKAAMLAITRTLAFEEAGHGVRVNAICPGSTLTDFHVKRTEAAGGSVEKLKGERNTTSLLGRWAEPMEIAYPILWLASDEASFITGTTVLVDGGLHIV